MTKQEFDKIRKEEGDEISWNHHFFKCKIIRHPIMHHLCGYVGVPKKHSFYKLDYIYNNLEVHGGLTYTGKKENKNYWYFGFECGHYGDYIPGIDILRNMSSTYRTVDYVKKEMEKLVNFLEYPKYMSIIYQAVIDDLVNESEITKEEKSKLIDLLESNPELAKELIFSKMKKIKKTFGFSGFVVNSKSLWKQ